jgi:hypothetical protein
VISEAIQLAHEVSPRPVTEYGEHPTFYPAGIEGKAGRIVTFYCLSCEHFNGLYRPTPAQKWDLSDSQGYQWEA